MNVLITGGFGFIGCNLVLDRLARADVVRVLDDLSRPGSADRAGLLESAVRGTSFDAVVGDVRDQRLVQALVREADVVFHLAGQVAVTTSVENPREDFEVNALGTLNVLEAARLARRPPTVVYASTNKVYGGLEYLGVHRTGSGYVLEGLPGGVSEAMPLDFHSPYGCSKGAGDQYTLDYARVFRIPTIVMRQSCIYGPWQFGNEDQGWLAHFASQLLQGRDVTIYGDGFQVRDVLYVGDLLMAYELASASLPRTFGRAYNVGGGSKNALSLNRSLELLAQQLKRRATIRFGPWRPGDQRAYVSDVTRAREDFGWHPSTAIEQGIALMIDWLTDALDSLEVRA